MKLHMTLLVFVLGLCLSTWICTTFLLSVTKKTQLWVKIFTEKKTLFWILSSLYVLYTRNMKLAYGEPSLISLSVDRKSPSQMHHVSLSFALLNLFVN